MKWENPAPRRHGPATDAWTTIAYPKAVFDEPTGRWISRAEVAEIDFVAFTSKKKADQVPGRFVVRRIATPAWPHPRRPWSDGFIRPIGGSG